MTSSVDAHELALQPTPNNGLVTQETGVLVIAGQVANEQAAQGVFADYLSRKADNTIRRQAADLARFAAFLDQAGEGAGLQLGAALGAFAESVAAFPDGAVPEAEAWRGVTWGLVEAFRNRMVAQGDAVGSINVRLSTVKAYARLATKAGVLTAEELAMIRTVAGYAHKEARRIDERRETSRRGSKKAGAVRISHKQARKLKAQPDTPQGHRDALLMCLLLDHGLRVGEVAWLQVSDFDLKAGEMRFLRPKVDKVQTHKLSADTLRALQAWVESGDARENGSLLRGSRKGGALTNTGMSERAITERVRVLGEEVGLAGLSAHDCRHYWATYWARKVDVLRLQEAGGWSSLAMPRRYVEDSEIANEGMA
ncbi:MAG: tyrosine-type recombinase/integrase [Anaerolineae bacterium]|nr:tyrosine-type recombinase/integrase [Anaerolineae bacterium]